MIIAFRTLTYAPLDGGPDVAIAIRLYAPEDFAGASKCRIEIDWPDGQLQSYGAGVDDFQAIELALQMIGMRIYLSPYHESGRLWFERPGGGYGFPVPYNMRDLLVGTDREMYCR